MQLKDIFCILQVGVFLVTLSFIYHLIEWWREDNKSYIQSLIEYLFERSWVGLFTVFLLLTMFVISFVLISSHLFGFL